MQNKFLIRFWFEFEGGDELFALGLKLGCGITAFSYEDAIYILKKEIFGNESLPIIRNCIENIDIRDLDQGHIVPNIFLTPSFRGVWYPMGYNHSI